jgi:hypothetical protein
MTQRHNNSAQSVPYTNIPQRTATQPTQSNLGIGQFGLNLPGAPFRNTQQANPGSGTGEAIGAAESVGDPARAGGTGPQSDEPNRAGNEQQTGSPSAVSGQTDESPNDPLATITALQRRIAELEAKQAQPDQLFVDEATLERVRAISAISPLSPSKSTKTPSLPDMIPGYKASSLSLPPPKRVEEACRLFNYIPYSALSLAARRRAASGDEEITISAEGGLTMKGLDRRNEFAITELDWNAAAKTTVGLIRRFHGDARADALASHNEIVLALGASHGWRRAVEYDIRQRELWHHDPSHDISSLDSDCLVLIGTRLQAMQTALPASAPGSPPSNHQPSRSLSNSFRKRSRTENETSRCFRCGYPGHLPADCSASLTAAKRQPATISPSTRSKHALADSSGKQYCFNWARNSICDFGQACVNAHACSICGSSSHGAGKCNFRA